MKRRISIAVVSLGAALVAASLIQPACAAYILDVDQVGANVVASGSGSLDVSDLGGMIGEGGFDSMVVPRYGQIVIGQLNAYGDVYGFTPSTVSFGSGAGATSFLSSGPVVGIQASAGGLFVPGGYVSGTFLTTSSATYQGETLAGLGLSKGSYTIKFGTGTDADTFTVNVGISTVPLPASAPLFGASLLALGAVGYGLKRNKAAAAA